MDALGSLKPVVSQPATVRPAPVLPSSSANASLPSIQLGEGSALMGLDADAAEQRRIDLLANAARSAPQPLGSQVFTMFKDATGQYITRFRDTNTGKVVYIPEPKLLRMSGNSGSSALNIKV